MRYFPVVDSNQNETMVRDCTRVTRTLQLTLYRADRVYLAYEEKISSSLA